MNAKIGIGIALVVIGIISFGFQAINYTQKDTVVDLGPLKVTTESERSIPLTPIIGVICVLSGGALIFLGRKS